MDSIVSDLRHAFRILAKSPGYATIVVLTLALGIAANTAMFSVLNAVLFRRAPGSHPEQLVWITARRGQSDRPRGLSYPDFAEVRARARQLAGATAYSQLWLSLGGGVPERIRGSAVNANFFELLGIHLQMGRSFQAGEDTPNGPHQVAVLSDGFWRRRFGADPDILGRPVVINGVSFSVVGVAPAGFSGFEINDDAPMAVWVPLGAIAEAAPEAAGMLTDSFSSGWIRSIGRLAPGATVETASAELAGIAAGLHPAPADPRDRLGLRAEAARGGVDPSNRRDAMPVLSLLMVVPLLVLVVAGANAANVLLARSLSRRKEMAVRRALGASRGRIVRQLLVESTVLALIAAGAGVLLSFWLTGAIGRFGDIPEGVVSAFTPDIRVLVATTMLAVGAGVLFGLAPAFAATRPELTPALKSEGITINVGTERHRLRDVLVVAQVAVALVLIVTAGLFSRSVSKALSADPGFGARQGFYLSFDLARQRYDSARQTGFQRAVLQAVGATPGVQVAALASNVPFGGRFEGTDFRRDDARDREGPSGYISSVSPEYFAALDIPVREGRGFTAQDNASAPPVAIINEQLARTLWPGEGAIGKRVWVGGRLGSREVVGITRTGKYGNLVEPERGQLYVPLAQRNSASLFLVVRTAADPARAAQDAQVAAQALDPDLPFYELTTFERAIQNGADLQHAGSAALTVFGVLALTLTLVGIYGVTAHAVTLRTREIGIRVSLGARAADVLGLFLGEGLRRSLVGVGIGVVATAALSKILARYLFGLSPTDALSFLTGAIIVVLGVAVASLVPARRAAAVDPMIALRHE